MQTLCIPRGLLVLSDDDELGFYTPKATELLASGNGKKFFDFSTAKIQSAEFYFTRLLPRVDSHSVVRSALAMRTPLSGCNGLVEVVVLVLGLAFGLNRGGVQTL